MEQLDPPGGFPLGVGCGAAVAGAEVVGAGPGAGARCLRLCVAVGDAFGRAALCLTFRAEALGDALGADVPGVALGAEVFAARSCVPVAALLHPTASMATSASAAAFR